MGGKKARQPGKAIGRLHVDAPFLFSSSASIHVHTVVFGYDRNSFSLRSEDKDTFYTYDEKASFFLTCNQNGTEEMELRIVQVGKERYYSLYLLSKR